MTLCALEADGGAALAGAYRYVRHLSVTSDLPSRRKYLATNNALVALGEMALCLDGQPRSRLCAE